MKHLVTLLVLALASFPINVLARDTQTLTDQEIRQLLIEKSIREYPGSCACPYNNARNGSRCGGRSAWSKKGGYAPLCFEADVNDTMVKQFRARQRPAR